MPQQPKPSNVAPATGTPAGWEDVPSGWEPVDGAPSPALDYSRLTANVKLNAKGEGEGTYGMQSPDGKFLSIPYSNVDMARISGFKIDPEDREKYANDLLASLRTKNPHAQRSALLLPDPFLTVSANPVEPWTGDWFKQKGYNAVRIGANLLPVAGGIVGGVVAAGAGVPTGPGDVLVATAGAAAGGAAGEGLRRVVNNLVFNEPTRDPKELMKAMALEGGIQGVSEATGRVGAIPLKAAERYFAETGLRSAQAGIRLLPSEAHGKAPSYIEKFLRGSVITSGMIDRFRVAQNVESQAAVDGLANGIATFSGTREDLGNLIQRGIEKHTADFRATQRALYDAIDKKAAGVMASTGPLKAFAKQALKELTEEEKLVDPSQLSATRSMLERIVSAPNNMSFAAIADARSSLLALVRDTNVPLAGKRAGLAKKLASLADDAMIDAAQKSKIPGFEQDIRYANSVTRTEHQLFEQNLVRQVVKTKKPEAIASLLCRSSVGLEEARGLFTVIPANLHAPIQRQVVLDVADGAIDKTSGMFNERKFAQRMDALGDDKGRIIFGSNWSNVKKLSEVLGHISGPSGLGGGGSGASLQNFTMLKNFVVAASSAVPIGLAARGEYETAGLTALGTAATEALFLRSLAVAMTHPEMTAKVLKVAQVLVRGTRIGVPAGIAATKSVGENRKRQGDARRAALQTLGQAKGEEQEPSQPPTLPELNAEAVSRKPVAIKRYARTATGLHGHKIGTDDGVRWFDVQTGQPVK